MHLKLLHSKIKEKQRVFHFNKIFLGRSHLWKLAIATSNPRSTATAVSGFRLKEFLKIFHALTRILDFAHIFFSCTKTYYFCQHNIDRALRFKFRKCIWNVMLTQLKIWGVGSNENLKSKLDKRAVKLWALPPVPFSYRPVLFLKTRAFFFPITHFRGCMKCSENSSKKIAKRKNILSSRSNLHWFGCYQFVHLFPPKTLMFFFFRRWFPLLQSPISISIKRRMFHLSRERIWVIASTPSL